MSIDDFGAGVTSLAYLGSLAVSELKLDRSFLTRLATGDTERNLALVRATIALGHKLNMRVVAEGIEDVDALNLLAAIGCDLAQGYFISQPMSAHDLALPSTPVVDSGPAIRRWRSLNPSFIGAQLRSSSTNSLRDPWHHPPPGVSFLPVRRARR